MENAIKRIKISNKESDQFAWNTRAWQPFIVWLKSQESEEIILRCLVYEVQNLKRPTVLDRLRTRYNSLRARRELEELERITNCIISLNFRK